MFYILTSSGKYIQDTHTLTKNKGNARVFQTIEQAKNHMNKHSKLFKGFVDILFCAIGESKAEHIPMTNPFTSEKSFQNAIQDLKAVIKPISITITDNPFQQAESIPELSELIQLAIHYGDGFVEPMLRAIVEVDTIPLLSSEHSYIEKLILDIHHEIELNHKTDEEKLILYRTLEQALQKRRKIKNEINIISNTSNKLLESFVHACRYKQTLAKRTYTPRTNVQL